MGLASSLMRCCLLISTTNKDGSRSSHLLARIVSLEEEVRKINAALVVVTERLEAETSRANVAERRALDYCHRLRIATENCKRAEQESARLREPVKRYELQLENAQKEIFRAQDIIDQVASQRNEAAAEAVKARTKARKLQEEKLVMLAREEGRRMGYQEGLSMGRRRSYDEEHHDGDENMPELGKATSDEEPNDSRALVQLRSVASIQQQPTSSESALMSETSLHTPLLPVTSLDEPETIHPIISSQPINVPITDGRIPKPDSYIQAPPRHELQQDILPTASSIATEVQDSRAIQQSEQTPVPPHIRSHDYVYQTPVPPSIPHRHVSLIASRTSTHPLPNDVANKHPGRSSRNEVYVGQGRSGNQPSRESTSRNKPHDQERRHSSRTKTESLAEKPRDDTSLLRIPPIFFMPSAVPHLHRSQEIVMPAPLGDLDDLRPRRFVPTESVAVRSHFPLDIRVSPPPRTWSGIMTPSLLGDVNDPQLNPAASDDVPCTICSSACRIGGTGIVTETETEVK
ncbi:hypothetical protein OG21DRAFT_902848 [Imleria badia]|nr:hypothetical protein OG21DRAFT_902848 [Imleria badia]